MVYEYPTHIARLGLEITRRCNLKCDHCLRGGIRREDIDPYAVISQLARAGIESVGWLLLTGGEISIVPDLVRETRMAFHAYGISVEGLDITINGHVFNQEFVDEIWEYQQCLTQEDNWSVRISNDIYHGGQVATDAYLEAFQMCGVNCHVQQDMSNSDLIGQGRAKKWQLGWRTPPADYQPLWYPENSTLDALYINPRGDVMDGCNYSYAAQAKRSLGNILTDPLSSIIVKQKPINWKQE